MLVVKKCGEPHIIMTKDFNMAPKRTPPPTGGMYLYFYLGWLLTPRGGHLYFYSGWLAPTDSFFSSAVLQFVDVIYRGRLGYC